jgi:hypothetical protein
MALIYVRDSGSWDKVLGHLSSACRSVKIEQFQALAEVPSALA